MSGLGEWDDEDETSWPAEREAETSAAAEPAAEDASSGPQLFYGSVDEFVREFLRFAYKRQLSGRTAPFWAGEWWKYDEAVMRLEALWRAWEFLRLDPATGMSVWWRDHADHHMRMLMAAEGPFGASQETAPRGEPLPYVRPPEGLFPDERIKPAE